MRAKIHRLSEDVELPAYQSAEAAGFDISASEDLTVQPMQTTLVPTGLIIQAPEGFYLQIAARSSLPLKKGLILANGIGVVDRDYCGPEDELRLIVFNFGNEPVQIKKGERLAQGLFLPIEQVEWEEVAGDIKGESRGGYGSSGGYHA